MQELISSSRLSLMPGTCCLWECRFTVASGLCCIFCLNPKEAGYDPEKVADGSL